MGYIAITQGQVDHDSRQRSSMALGINFVAALGTQIAAELVHELDADGKQLRVARIAERRDRTPNPALREMSKC